MTDKISLPRSDGAQKDLSELHPHVLSSIHDQVQRDVITAKVSAKADADHGNHEFITMKRTDGMHHDIISIAQSMSSSDDVKSSGSSGGGYTTSMKILSMGGLPETRSVLRIVHMSDTHNRLVPRVSKKANSSIYYPRGDILIHSGNFSISGSSEDFALFNDWLEYIKDLYPYRVVVLGSKDVKQLGTQWEKAKSLLCNATHVLCHESAEILGIKMYGCPWHWGIKSNGTVRPGAPSSTSLRCDEIPSNIDMLITHGPSFGLLDKVGGVREHWGSRELLEQIKKTEPKVHLHGHIKESRGFVSAFGKSPLVINASMTNTDKTDCVLYTCPFVMEATRIGDVEGRFHFHLAALEDD